VVEVASSTMTRLLLVEDDPSVRTTLVTFLELEGYEVEAVASTRDALSRLQNGSFPVVVSDIYIDDRTGLDVLNAARQNDPSCAVILMTGRGSMETVMAATQNGAFDYLAKPFELDDMLDAIKRAEAARHAPVIEDEDDELPETEMIGVSANMIEIYKTLAQVAPTNATVLIEGESGTGKELIARMIHRNSLRSNEAFIPVDCASLTPALMESELFGAMKGAFTGSDRDRIGLFEAAHKGTAFLDEIGDIDLNSQLKLLRFLQEREVRPLGSAKARQVDVRVVAATNRNLQQMVDEERFREDLWFRLNVVRILLPPLRERHGDLPLLSRHFVKKYNGRYQKSASLTDTGLQTLLDYTWPGNIRQLQHLLERLVILTPQGRIDRNAVEEGIHLMEPRDTGGETLADTEADQIKRVLAATNGNKSRAARILGIERKTLYRKLERMGL
jgi:DNA-binding NtrC family response regulator